MGDENARTVDGIFAWILETVADAGYLSPKAVFIDGTHIKANANTKKQVKLRDMLKFTCQFGTFFLILDKRKGHD